MNNMEKESVMRETKVWTRSVGKRRGDSTLPIEEKVQFLRDEYTFPGGIKLTLDSSDPKIKIDNHELTFLGMCSSWKARLPTRLCSTKRPR